MNQPQPVTPEDPRLTAYALGELEGAERDAVAAAVAASVPLQQQVELVRAQADAVDDAYALFNRVDGDAALFAQVSRRLEEEAAALRNRQGQQRWDGLEIPVHRPYLWWTPYALPAAATFVALLSVGALWWAGIRDSGGSGLEAVDAFLARKAPQTVFTQADTLPREMHASMVKQEASRSYGAEAGASLQASAGSSLSRQAPLAAEAVAASGATATPVVDTSASAPVALPGLLGTRDVFAQRRWAAEALPEPAVSVDDGRMLASASSASSTSQPQAAAVRTKSSRQAVVGTAAFAALPSESPTVASAPVLARAAVAQRAFSAPAPVTASLPADATARLLSESSAGEVVREAQALVQPVAVTAEEQPASGLETQPIPVRPPLPLPSADAQAQPALSGAGDNFEALMAAAAAVMERRLSTPQLNVAEPVATPLPPKLDLSNAYVQLALWIEAGQLPPPRQVDVAAIVDAMKTAVADEGQAAGMSAVGTVALEQALRSYAQVLHQRPADASARLDAIAASLGTEPARLSEPQVSRFLSLLRETQKLLPRN